MSDPKTDLAKSWLNKAKRDLDTAHKLSIDPDPYLDTAVYHCQQTAEKAIKAYLVFHDRKFEKTHDIEVLLQLAIPFNNDFSKWLDAGDILTPYVAIYRYPGDIIEPTLEEFNEAYQSAERIYHFVKNLLPEDIR